LKLLRFVLFSLLAPGVLHVLVDESGRPFERLEASGVAYVQGRLAVVDDTVNSLFLFDTGGRLVERLDSDRFPGSQAKFEDISFAPYQSGSPGGTFFVVGAHSGLDGPMLERHSVLLEFRLRELGAIETASVRPLPLYRAFERLGLWRAEGMKIEGLAVGDEGESLYVGLREPVDRARVYRIVLDSLRREEAMSPELVVEFDAGLERDTPYCVSAMAWDESRGGLLIATSTENESTHRFHGNRLWFAEPFGEPLLLLDRFDEGLKAEGLTLGGGELFVVYDNDQDDTGLESRLRVMPQRDLSFRTDE
jgi:hypothetical protein